jgi:hypothetical protein
LAEWFGREIVKIRYDCFLTINCSMHVEIAGVPSVPKVLKSLPPA